jgi:hypothetical protein
MIPPLFDPGTASPGEKEIFHRLRDDPGTENWIVLHSLLLARHPTRVSGEADFVVIIPDLGVLVVEVKACRSLRVIDGLWYYGHDPNPDPRGPFKQASEAMHAVRAYATTQRPELSRIVFWSAVVFPYVPFDIRSDEWNAWQVVDAPRFRQTSISETLGNVLVSARKMLASAPSARWFDPVTKHPTRKEAELLLQILRPRFEVFESAKLRRGRVERELERFTEEQYEALDAIGANQRVILEGPAGTGKTLLALEALRRSGVQGRRSLLICRSPLLGAWLGDRTKDMGDSVRSATFAGILAELTGRGDGRREDLGEEILAEALVALLEGRASLEVDELIVDEAQDLLRDDYLDVFDLCLRGGLSAGRWRFFGDFERQVLFDPGVDLDGLFAGRLAGATRHSLRVNCRNTPRMTAFTHLLGRLHPDYRRVRRPDDGVEPRVVFAAADRMASALQAELEVAVAEKYSPEEIVILLPDRREPSLPAQLPERWRRRTRPLATNQPGHVGYGPIEDFKGLESPVVIVADVLQLDGRDAETLFYVASTRALDRLTFIISED